MEFGRICVGVDFCDFGPDVNEKSDELSFHDQDSHLEESSMGSREFGRIDLLF